MLCDKSDGLTSHKVQGAHRADFAQASASLSVDRFQVEIVDFHRGLLLEKGDGHDQPRLAATDEHRALHACQCPTSDPNAVSGGQPLATAYYLKAELNET